MKEIRVYGVSTIDYESTMSDNEFIETAENEGNVWSIDFFNKMNVPIRNLVLKIFEINI